MSQTPAQKLYRAPFLVKPTPDHPWYFDWDMGVLLIYMVADSEVKVAERARKIVAALPYDVRSEGAVKESSGDAREWVQNAKQSARDIGIGVALNAGTLECRPEIDALVEEANDPSDSWKLPE